MPDMLITKTNEEPGAASLTVTVPVERVREAEERATQTYLKRARLPGFRRGKAPPAMVRRQFAKDIREQVLQDLVRESWRRAVEQEALKPIADPHVHNLSWEDGAPLRFELHVEVRPEVSLARLGGFRLHRQVAPVTAEQVEAQLGELRDQRAPWLPVEGESPRPKDLVQVSIAQGLGAEAKDGQSHQFVLGEGRAIPDLEERILALRPGETVDATVRYPADFPDEAKRGQTRDVRVTLQEVKRQQLAELTDDFAREVGDFDSLDALRRAIREDLERDAAREADARVRAELIEQLVAANNVVAPRPLVERALWVYAQAYGVPEERLPQFATEFRSLAEQQVRRDLVLDHVAERERLRAGPEEVEQRLRELAERRRTPVEQLRASLEKAGRLRDLERGLTEEKIFTFLLSQSTVEQT
jgi:trigger factor